MEIDEVFDASRWLIAQAHQLFVEGCLDGIIFRDGLDDQVAIQEFLEV